MHGLLFPLFLNGTSMGNHNGCRWLGKRCGGGWQLGVMKLRSCDKTNSN